MSEQDHRMWASALATLRRSHPALNRQWFDELRPLGLSSGQLAVRAASTTHRDYLQRMCIDAFNDAVQKASGRLLSVRFLGPDDPAELRDIRPGFSGLAPPPETVSRATPDVHRRRGALVINPDNTFDNFVIGTSNRYAHAAAVAVAEKPGTHYNPLFIHGGVGLGKTHLLQAICLRLLERQPGLELYYVSCDEFASQLHESIQNARMSEFREKFRGVDVLVIDDIHFLTRRDQTQEEFFHTFNELQPVGKRVILSSDAAPEQIPHLEQRLISRFHQGMVVEVEPPSFDTRVAILKKKALMRDLTLTDDVAQFVASRVESNIRELEGALNRLQHRHELEALPISLELAREVFVDHASKNNEPTLNVVIKVVTDFYGVRTTDLQSKRRHRSITVPRQVCMYLARRHTRHSLEEIGGQFGGRDHTTVMHAVQTIEDRRKQSAEFDQQITMLDQRLANGSH